MSQNDVSELVFSPADYQNKTPLIKATTFVDDYIFQMLGKTFDVPAYNVYVVWFCYILGGWKALVSSTIADEMYYEVTYNQAKKETYLDAYKKQNNVVLHDVDKFVDSTT